MALVSLQNLSIGFHGPNLLDEVNCQIEHGGKIGLLGRNGAGKSTLLRMLRGDVEPDHGKITMATNQSVAYLQQDVPAATGMSVRETVAQGLRERNPESEPEESGWESEHALERTLSQMQLEAAASFDDLSSGMKRRVLLAQAVVSKPDLLLLDEPTNHLDISAIRWLEDFLIQWSGTLIFVTHDRMFLRSVADRILEIDRGQLFDWSCNYETFLQRKEAALIAQEKQEALFDKRLAQEEAWIRQGIKARRTRNEGRVRALKKMREQRAGRQQQSGTMQLRIEEGQRSGNLVAQVESVTFSYGDQMIIPKFSTTIMRGDKIGVIGPNGAGKTTLLKVLLGKLKPATGRVKLGANLEIAYFDQLRAQLNEEQTIEENVGGGRPEMSIGGRSRHIIGYLQEFLFSPDRCRTKVKFLSGGERNRVLLAKLFTAPANVIVLDEPTNDLDTESLEMLEEKLVEYPGTLLLVSHDREFLNHVVTSTIAFEDQRLKEYVGGYDDWLQQRASSAPQEKASKPPTAKATKKPTASDKRRLSFKETRELEELPAKIEELETQIQDIHDRMADPAFYQRDGDAIATDQRQLQNWEEQLATAYSRWEELEQLA